MKAVVIGYYYPQHGDGPSEDRPFYSFTILARENRHYFVRTVTREKYPFKRVAVINYYSSAKDAYHAFLERVKHIKRINDYRHALGKEV